MSKQAISVTLDPENILWLKARTRGAHRRSVSETLDRLLNEVRTGKSSAPEAQSVRGTVRIDVADPDFEEADAAVSRLIASSLSRVPARDRRAKRGRG